MPSSTFTQDRAQGASTRLPRAIGLSLAAAVSLGLWAAIFEAVAALRH